MLKNYFKSSWRNIQRNKTFSIIKIFGLSIGLMVCMLIFLYTKDEISYDQFHVNKAKLYRVIQNFKFGDDKSQYVGVTNAIVGETFAKEIPEVSQVVRVTSADVTAKKDNTVFAENPLCVDNNFFSVFTFPLIEGNLKTALKDPNAVVLSRDLAKKYFGTVDVIGKTMQLKIDTAFENFIITAVAENAPQNSTLKADMYLPLVYFERYNSNKDWFGGSMNTIVLLTPQANSTIVKNKMQSIFDKNIKSDLEKIKQEHDMTVKIALTLQPFTDIHLSKQAGPDNGMQDGSKPAYSYILSCIAVFILIIACINFINLATAQSLKRSKEIGIRKVVGGTRKQLIKQFLTESFLVSLIAFVIAIVLTIALLPLFNQLANKKLSLSYLSDGYLYAAYFLLLLVTSFIAGFYPSLLLSAFQPVKVLYSKQKLLGKNYFTKSLIVLQFALAIFLIIGAVVINSQLNFLSHTDLGYNAENLVAINIPVNKSSDKLPDLFKNELANRSDILMVAAKNSGRSISGVKANGKQITIEKARIDENFLPAFKIPIVAGRNFSPDYPSDLMHSVIVNETFVKEAGWDIDHIVGKTINFIEPKRPAVVIGVIKDYHFVSLKEKIMPEVLSMDTNFNYGQIWVKIDPKNIPQTLATLQSTFKKIVPYFPYTYQFMNDINAKRYETEAKWKQIINIASALFIFISCIGLLGLVILSIEQRTKEIGIRKVLGAAVSRIVLLVSKEFIILISIALLVAIPVGYYFVDKWLQDFAYRIHISWWMFALSGALVIAVALITISFHAIKAAIANPVKSLRTE